MWDSVTRLLGQTPKKDGSVHETYTAADSPSILAQQKWLAAEEGSGSEEDPGSPAPLETPIPSPAPAGSIIDRQQQMVDQLQHQIAERDATVASLLKENLVVLRTFKAELEASESGVSNLETRVSTLEASEAETTQMMGATFQKDAQQRLELKHSKAREKEKEHEIEVLKAELQAARADTEAARNRIKELEDGHLASIIDNDVDDDEAPTA